MQRWFMFGLLAFALSAAGCTALPRDEGCAAAEPIGRFDPASDLLLAHFDIKTDVDDLHAAAALATMLSAKDFACVRAVPVAGTYGMQGGDYVEGATLFDLAFPEGWIDAHADREGAVETIAVEIVTTLRRGGDVWIMEAGQSDVSAAAVERAMMMEAELDYAGRVHLVQHSDWNQDMTSPDALEFVRREIDYVRIPDGNAVGNGSPGFNTSRGDLWALLEADPRVGGIWREARRLADASNGVGYDNPSVRAGGIDFSDVSEAAYIFGYEALSDTEAFIATFVTE